MHTELRGDKFFLIDEESKDVGYIQFEKQGQIIKVLHTIITPKYRGQGKGQAIVEAFLKSYPKEEYELSSQCWFFTKITGIK